MIGPIVGPLNRFCDENERIVRNDCFPDDIRAKRSLTTRQTVLKKLSAVVQAKKKVRNHSERSNKQQK